MKPINLYDWLSAHPAIAISIFWEDVNGEHPYLFWDPGWRTELQEAFDLARQNSSIPVHVVPPNTAILADNEFPTTILSHDDAWAYFKATVAQSLAVEIDDHFTWSLTTYSEAELAELFNSREMFYWDTIAGGYRIDNMHGWVVPAPPSFSFKFLSTNNMLANTAVKTMANLIGWCTANLLHFAGGETAANMQDIWQYRGLPPMTRVIGGTVQTSQASEGKRHFTAGCWGTTGLLRAALRSVNIPVKLVTNATHAQPWFMTGACYLCHGDDPYNLFITSALPPIPSDELFIDQTKYEDWFGPNVSAAQKSKNIGRHLEELAITYLPLCLLWDYCTDVQNSSPLASGQVFANFSDNYTVAELEAHSLWHRLANRVESLGGCGQLPPLD